MVPIHEPPNARRPLVDRAFCSYIFFIYEWDDTKRRTNLTRHGVDFVDAEFFEWDTALTAEDDRCLYGESRYVSIGFVDDRLHVLVWTPRGDAVRVISLRKANKREVRGYVDATEHGP